MENNMNDKNKDDIFYLKTQLETIANNHEYDSLRANLKIVILYLEDVKNITTSKITKIKKMVHKIIVIYDKHLNNPNVAKIEPLLYKIIKIINN